MCFNKTVWERDVHFDEMFPDAGFPLFCWILFIDHDSGFVFVVFYDDVCLCGLECNGMYCISKIDLFLLCNFFFLSKVMFYLFILCRMMLYFCTIIMLLWRTIFYFIIFLYADLLRSVVCNWLSFSSLIVFCDC